MSPPIIDRSLESSSRIHAGGYLGIVTSGVSVPLARVERRDDVARSRRLSHVRMESFPCDEVDLRDRDRIETTFFFPSFFRVSEGPSRAVTASALACLVRDDPEFVLVVGGLEEPMIIFDCTSSESSELRKTLQARVYVSSSTLISAFPNLRIAWRTRELIRSEGTNSWMIGNPNKILDIRSPVNLRSKSNAVASTDARVERSLTSKAGRTQTETLKLWKRENERARRTRT